MGSMFFRRPTDDSSSSSSSSESDDSGGAEPSQHQSEDSVEREVDVATTESLSSHGSISVGEGQDVPLADFGNIDQHRSILLSALLEDFVKNRACEEMNKANPGRNFTRHSPEIQPLAQRLFQQASQPLALNGWITPTATIDNIGSRQTRATYLAGIETLALGHIQSGQALPDQARSQIPLHNQRLAVTQGNSHAPNSAHLPLGRIADLTLYQGSSPSPSPYSDLVFTSPTVRPSHYESSFQQLKFLGRGGFGAVYHTYNLFDKKEYAVKKIPLSPRLSQRYRESGHKELENILREVQALAQLEHNNVVRYHATWIEEPRSAPSVVDPPRKPSLTVQGRKLIAAAAASSSPASHDSLHLRAPEQSDGIVFGSDSVSKGAVTEVHVDDESALSAQFEKDSISARTSEIFTDGHARPNARAEAVLDGSVYVLHVQMSVYPLTLAQYLAPPARNAGSATSSLSRRHCFHLVPALRILMGILCGLQYIHAKGLIHRDIKPSNIFIASMGLDAGSLIPEGFHDVGSCVGCSDPSPYYVNPRIGDFGLVAEFRVPRVETGDAKAVGTEYFRPPPFHDPQEKWKSNTIDEKLDVFALGVILVEMLRYCTTSTERMHVLQDLQKGKIPPDLVEKVDGEGHAPGTGNLVLECISGMIERNPVKRWSCAAVTERIGIILNKCKTFTGAGTDQRDTEEMRKVRSLDERDGEPDAESSTAD